MNNELRIMNQELKIVTDGSIVSAELWNCMCKVYFGFFQ